MNFSKKICAILVFVFIVILAMAVWAYHRFRIPTYLPADMKTFSKKIHTHCVGRYLIDLPDDLGNPSVTFAVLYFGLGADFNSVEVRIPIEEDMDRAKFDKMVTLRRNELKKTFNASAGAMMLLAERRVETPNGDAVLLRRLDSKHLRNMTVQSELHAFVKGRYVILAAESFPPESAFNNRAADVYKLADPHDSEERLIRVAQQLKGITNPELAGPGFCMNGVLIDQWLARYDEEKVIFDFHAKGHIQPKLSISMEGKFGYGTETLFDRSDRLVGVVANLTNELLVRKIRKTERQIGGMAFQEWAHEAYRKDEKTTNYDFMIQNLAPSREDKRLERPSTSIVLESHGADSSKSSEYSLSQLEEAWDQWLSTFRLSPGNGGKQR